MGMRIDFTTMAASGLKQGLKRKLVDVPDDFSDSDDEISKF